MEKLWLNSYEQGVNPEIDISQYSSISDVFRQSVEKFSDKPAFQNMGKTLTYAEVGKLATDFASYLQNVLKLPRGERVAIMMPNVLQYPIALFGILQAGLVAVNTNPLYTPRELEHQLKDSGATTIVVLENFANTLELVLPRTQIKHVIVASVGEMFGMIKGALMNFVIRKVKKMVPEYRIPNTITFQTALKQGAANTFKPVELTRDDTALLQYTGGTTGLAKGAVLSHGNICANMLQAKEWIKNSLHEGKETVIAALPLYHIFALTVNLMIFANIGSKIILITNPRDMKGFIGELKKEPISVFIGVNTLFNAMVNRPDFAEVDFSRLKLTLGGGMATQKAVAEKWKKITGTPIVEAYGLTEASPGVCCNPLNIESYSGGIGLPVPSTEVELRDADGKEVPIGQPGELWVRGPQVMKGYWNRPEETAKAIDARGFLETGDIAVMDEKGWLKLVDRKKDLIVVSGFNVYPNEIEEVVAGSDKVLEVACIGVKSEKTGEAIKVFVVRKDPSLTKEELIDFCRKELTAYKVPKDIEFRDELPKSNVGKILRRELR
ncbi:long-chain-fatty-acid--CoA ligase [Neisseria flavescens]|uniref:Long-chain-fatty-acid--CoA ligase n=1 Tax=Neisseria flavescens NRL30031/H210 TaxID=546264 RepID=C0EQF6_NEIFL|nr:AMP-binding protein [Neisseria flavescens]SPY01609.1 long-chain-fatty-acid--CoA-ligase [Neisseria meningitidis]EEG32714.1 AMP-binding enzyme [Neisseria flavescens NRL30031/H210]QCL68283.1 long-chain-fatty-acid--CoA ligase [Neisseria flavescens]SPY05882.1 long-chain-fatty-acid--CoA-ligase [Neisseria meningitidis]STZ64724.1 long-chain-fatty-acid--CoA-ligase [Neisseria flavescens]